MNLTRADVERIVESVLERLDIKVDGENYYSNERTIVLSLDGREITRTVLFLNERFDE